MATEHQLLRILRFIAGGSVRAIDQHREISKMWLRKTCLHQQFLPINFLKFCPFLEMLLESCKLWLPWRLILPAGVKQAAAHGPH